MENALSKEKLRQEFANNYGKYYKVKIFEEEGFVRKKCKICGRFFWTLDPNRETCEDSSHTVYDFFKDKPTDISYENFWDKFSGFFKSNGHAIIKRYPVVSRWRQDLYFTIAGIQDFQRIENGAMSFEYPANPLLIPQICLRFNDIENVGITGRHFTSFMMANQTAFNWPNEGYWKDETIRLNFEFMTKVLGAKKEDIVYHEDVWAMPDFSGFGPSLETFSKGLEIVNNVFTEFGLSNGEIKELGSKVVDVGWGFERALWFYTGYGTAYQAAFNSAIQKLKKEIKVEIAEKAYDRFAKYAGSLDFTETHNINEKIIKILDTLGMSEKEYNEEIKPVQELYALIDHVRTLLFAITDGALPSNIGGGYNLRVILRRALDFANDLGLRISLGSIAAMIAEDLSSLYPELADGLDIFAKVLDVEKTRYAESIENARKKAESVIGKKAKLEPEDIRVLYESYGITPEMLSKIAAQEGKKIEMPENPYASIIGSDIAKREKGKKLDLQLDLQDLQKTKPLYYDFATEAKAKVIYSKGKYVILDQTPFYPEGGGQAPDAGEINGINVVDAQKIGGVIVHVLEKEHEFQKGETVNAKIDIERRNRLIAHHTATHLISAATRKVLGKHAWQEGASKGPEKAHIDIAHYEKLSDNEINKIEDVANEWLRQGIKVNVETMKRGDAETKYGFTIYQGHGVPAKEMRIVTISLKDGTLIDAEACGGLHAVGRESLLGIIKILNAERIHDGVDRLEFVAGPAALDYFRKEHNEIMHLSTMLNIDPSALEKRMAEIIENTIKNEKQQERNYEAIAKAMASYFEGKDKIEMTLDLPRALLRSIANELIKRNEKGMALLSNSEGEVVCIAGKESKVSALEYVKSKYKNFVGGGGERFAEGRIAK
ncbi:MAG: alanine--tRNA ligase [Candidatus Micrarchaeia archaeon]